MLILSMLRAKMVSVLFTTLQNSYNLSLLVLARIYIFGFFINAMYEKVVEVVDINGYIIFFSRLKNWRDNTFFQKKKCFYQIQISSVWNYSINEFETKEWALVVCACMCYFPWYDDAFYICAWEKMARFQKCCWVFIL